MSDEGFHEIQLNGKQLVFLFMAATVVSVVIFLCGVLVGRGVRDRTMSVAAAEGPAAPTPDTATTDSASVKAAPEPAATNGPGKAQPSAPQVAAAPPANPPPPPPEDEGYYDSLVKDQKDTRVGTPKGRGTAAPVKPRERPPTPKASATATPSPAPAPAVAVAERPASSSGYAVQLAAVRERNEAEAIARRLVSKGYQAYVLVPQPGKPPVYRVQVGRFKSRGEADRVASRLRKNEQFKPWVTR